MPRVSIFRAATLPLLFCLMLLCVTEAGAASSYIDFDSHDTYRELASGSKSGVKVKGASGGAGLVKLAAGKKMGILTSRAKPTSTRFDTLVPSWNAVTPKGTWMRTEVRVRSGGRWTGWFNMGTWSTNAGSSRRQSQDGQGAGSWGVSTDTLQSRGQVFADAYQYRLKLYTEKKGRSPWVRAVYATASDSYRHGEFLGVAGNKYLGTDIPVPPRSQMIYPDGGEVWCSPTSLSMVMAYWANRTGQKNLNQPVPTVARNVYDYEYRGNGNWPFNTAYASAFGLKASVNRFSSLGQLERWVAKGVPVIVSIAWGPGQLDNAPIRSTAGHLLVVRGFNRDKTTLIVNDPAASSNSGVRRVYNREQFARAWFQNGSGGVGYVIHPRGWPTPSSADAMGSW